MEYSDTLAPHSTLLDEYEIIRVLGSGGFGNTYLARDVTLSREVAIKEYYPREIAIREANTTVRVKGEKFASSFQWGLDRFVQEARLLAKFRHPNIVRVFRTFDANGTAYIVLDYVQGTDLDGWLVSIGRRPTQQEMDELLTPLLDALALVHAVGVLHRDIKPANICVREETGDPILLDFGASKWSLSELTGTTAAIVSRGYSPYEAYAADSKSQGAWTDIYGLGATIYRALMETAPPEATERLLEDTIVPLAGQALPGFRPGFLAAVDAALSVQPKSRPQSIEEWRSRLFGDGVTVMRNWEASQRLLGGSPTGAAALDALKGPASATNRPATAAPAKPTPAARRSGGATAALVTGGLAVIGVGGAIAAAQLGYWDADRLRSLAGLGSARTGPEAKTAPVAASSTAAPAQVAMAPAASQRPAGPPTSESPPAAAPPAPPSQPAVAAPEPPAAPVAPVRAASATIEPAAPPRPAYRTLVLGSEGQGRQLLFAAVSGDGRSMAGGEMDGTLRHWNVESGRETQVRGAGTPIVGVDFVGQHVVAAMADGSLSFWSPGAAAPKPISGAGLLNGFIRSIAYNSVSDDVVAVATSAQRTQLTRWRLNGESVSEPIDLGNYMVRAAAVARNADLTVVVKSDETLVAIEHAGSKLPTTLELPKAADWSSALALSPDGRLLARGGLYPAVTVFDMQTKAVKREISLGSEQNQPQTKALAFSGDGSRIAILYQHVRNGLAEARLQIVGVTGGEPVELEVPRTNTGWASFLPLDLDSAWIAFTQAGSVRICDVRSSCPVATASR